MPQALAEAELPVVSRDFVSPHGSAGDARDKRRALLLGAGSCESAS